VTVSVDDATHALDLCRGEVRAPADLGDLRLGRAASLVAFGHYEGRVDPDQ
jgi:hypothetical protein